jgi:hypothetical protein
MANTEENFDLDNLSPEMKADLDAYYDWLEVVGGEQEMPEDYALSPAAEPIGLDAYGWPYNKQLREKMRTNRD